MDIIYRLPLSLHQQGLDDKVTELLGIWASRPDMEPLNKVVENFENPKGQVKIGIVGKYTHLIESYKSLDEALRHAALSHGVEFCPVYIDSEGLEAQDAKQLLQSVQGILVPGGFGERGTEGKIKAIQYARENGVPYLGICLGMQLAMVEYARNMVGIKDATSEEFGGQGSAVIHYMSGQSAEATKGGSMRLGAYPCRLAKGSRVQKIYGAVKISERHRHRLEVNNDYISKLEDVGLVVSGRNEELNLVEVVELPEHPFFIGCQYHPEFKSRLVGPHPLFKSFVGESLKVE